MPGGQVWNIPTRMCRVVASKARDNLYHQVPAVVRDNLYHPVPAVEQENLYHPVPAVAEQLGPNADGEVGEDDSVSPNAWKVLATQSEVVLQYLEYCLTALILWVSVLFTLVTAQLLWMVQLGFVGIFACNL